MTMTARYPLGTMFRTRHKHPRLCTVTDILKTYNNAGELVKIRYVATYGFMNQIVTDSDVVETTITMGIVNPGDI